ncbi:MAG: adenylate/guanylate cyclase domain-containing protein [Alphaproteobacteria bacterium]|nr:adenylate/guanylate cyclase domain-containing protein [Alphaproteobacteria bacterium]
MAGSTRAAPFLLVLGIALFVTLIFRVFPFWNAEEAVADARLALLGPVTAEQNAQIALVTITEDTLALLPYRSPVDRALLADVTLALKAAGARAVGFDILFDRPTEPDKDEAFLSAVRGEGAPVVLAWADTSLGLDDVQVATLEAFIAVSGARAAVPVLVVDADGTVRRLSPRQRAGKPSLPLALAEAAGETPPRIEGRISYLRPPADGTDTFLAMPAHAVIPLSLAQPEMMKTLFGGKIVLIGADLPLDDRHRTPFAVLGEESAGRMAGVAIHAQMLAQLLDGRRIHEGWWVAVILNLVFAAWGAAWALGERKGWAKVLAMVGGLVVLWTGGFLAFARTAWLLPLAAPTVAGVLSFGGASVLSAWRERSAKRFIRDAFARFVSPEVVKRLQADPSKLELGGERRALSFIFTDVAGFTTLAEGLPPHELVTLVNRYLDGMSQVVLDHGGTIDKYIGDAVVAFFGAPLDQPDHPARAVACALALDRFAEDFRAAHPRFGTTRIGIHAGDAVVGNFGGAARIDYTAMGDTVNTAARLEGANKFFGTRVLVSGPAAAGAPGAALRPVGEVVFKGKSEPVPVFTPVTNVTAAETKAARYAQAYESLKAGEEGAPAAFQSLAAEDPEDGLVAFHLRRLARGERGVTIKLEEK